MPNGDKLFRRTFLLGAKTHQERATFNNASRTTESPNVDEPRTRGVVRGRTRRSTSSPKSNLKKFRFAANFLTRNLTCAAAPLAFPPLLKCDSKVPVLPANGFSGLVVHEEIHLFGTDCDGSGFSRFLKR